MPSANRYYLTGFYISFFLYALIFVSLVYAFGNSSVLLQRYTSKQNFLDIILVERPKDITETGKSATSPTRNAESAKAATKTQTAGVQDLFKKIDTSKMQNEGDKQTSTPSRLAGKNDAKADNASKILDRLEFKQASSLMTASSSAEYDEYKGKIQDMLIEKWQNTIETESGAEAEVLIKIDSMGYFSYSIEKPSYNADFNFKLENFLEERKQEIFPIHKDGEFSLQTTFRDLSEVTL